jgi:hypothetical protein
MTAERAPPSSVTTGTRSSFALRSQSAVSTAEIAIAATPARPRFRTVESIAWKAVGIAIASSPRTTGASTDWTSWAVARSA